MPNFEYRINLGGTALCCGRVVDGETLAIWAGRLAKVLKGSLKESVQRAEVSCLPVFSG